MQESELEEGRKPAAIRRPRRLAGGESIRGVTIADPYRWMHQAKPDHPWIQAEISRADAYMQALTGRRRISRLLKEYGARSVGSRHPVPVGDRWLVYGPNEDGEQGWALVSDDALGQPAAVVITEAIWLKDPWEIVRAAVPATKHIPPELQGNTLLDVFDHLTQGDERKRQLTVALKHCWKSLRDRDQKAYLRQVDHLRSQAAKCELYDVCVLSPGLIDVTLAHPEKATRIVVRFDTTDNGRWQITDIGVGNGEGVSPVPSPDGKHIAAVVAPAYGAFHGYVVMLSAENGCEVGPPIRQETSPMAVWLADSQRILVNGYDSRAQKHAIRVEGLDGTGMHIPLPFDNVANAPSVSVQGDQIVMVERHEDGGRNVWRRGTGRRSRWHHVVSELPTDPMGVMIGRKYVKIDYSTVPEGRLVAMPTGQSGSRTKSWLEFQRAETSVIDAIHRVNDKLLVIRNDLGHSRLDILDARGKRLRSVSAPNVGTFNLFGGVHSLGENRILMWHSSGVDQGACYVIDTETGDLAPLAATLSIRESASVRRVDAIAKDGTRLAADVVMPLSSAELYDKGLTPKLPAVLYSYGHVGQSAIANVTPVVSTLVQLGCAYVFAHVRGGGEFGRGRYWQRSKTPARITQSDLFTITEALIDCGLVDRDRVGLASYCAGGILVAGAVAQRPELYRAAAITGPLTDPIQRSRDAKTGRLHVREAYGSYASARLVREFVASSGYHTLAPRCGGPAVFLGWVETDRHCPPWHSWKFAAALSYCTVDAKGPLVLRKFSGDSAVGAIFGYPLPAACDLIQFFVKELDIG